MSGHQVPRIRQRIKKAGELIHVGPVNGSVTQLLNFVMHHIVFIDSIRYL